MNSRVIIFPCEVNSEVEFRDEISRRKTTLQSHQSLGELLERENAVLRAQIKSLSEAYEKNENFVRSRMNSRQKNTSNTEMIDLNDIGGVKKSMTCGFEEGFRPQATTCIPDPTRAVIENLLEVRDKQVLRLKAEAEEKDKEIEELRAKVRDCSASYHKRLSNTKIQIDNLSLQLNGKTDLLQQKEDELRRVSVLLQEVEAKNKNETVTFLWLLKLFLTFVINTFGLRLLCSVRLAM